MSTFMVDMSNRQRIAGYLYHTNTTIDALCAAVNVVPPANGRLDGADEETVELLWDYVAFMRQPRPSTRERLVDRLEAEGGWVGIDELAEGLGVTVRTVQRTVSTWKAVHGSFVAQRHVSGRTELRIQSQVAARPE